MCTLYERIIELCKAKGVSGSRMCLDLGLSKSTLSDIKSGRKKGVSTATAQKIASYFGVSVEYLLSGKGIEMAPLFDGVGGVSSVWDQRTKDTSLNVLKCLEKTSPSKPDVLDEVDVAFYGEYKELSEDDKDTIRDMVRVMRERRAKKQE